MTGSPCTPGRKAGAEVARFVQVGRVAFDVDEVVAYEVRNPEVAGGAQLAITFRSPTMKIEDVYGEAALRVFAFLESHFRPEVLVAAPLPAHAAREREG